MKSRLGIILATTAAVGCAALFAFGADAQDQGGAVPQPPSAGAQPAPPAAGPRNFAPSSVGRGGGRARFSPQDRAAFFDARIAAIKAGLELTQDQETLWTPVEQAVRDLAGTMKAQRQKRAQEGRPTDPVERLQTQGDAAVARGQALQKLAAAAKPLWASLTDDQKRRLPILMHGMRARNMMGRRDDRQRQGGWRDRMRQRFSPNGGERDYDGGSQRN
jgi:hypothetical protein